MWATGTTSAAEGPPATAVEDSAKVEAVAVEIGIGGAGGHVGDLTGLAAIDRSLTLALEADGHRHVTEIRVRKAGTDGRTLRVVLGYVRDGAKVIEASEIDATAGTAQVVRSADGKVAIALKLALTQVEPSALAPVRPRRIDLPTDRTDPLAGLD